MEYEITRDPHAFDPQAVADVAVEEALRAVGGASLPSGNYPVILRWDAMSSLLQTFSGVFSAEQAQKGLSRLADKVGAVIAAPCVTLVDNPLLPGGFNSQPFDAEGVPTFHKDVIDAGKLLTLLHNMKTAAKAGVSSTGNAHKASFASPVTVAPSNFFLQAGRRSLRQLEESMGDGLVITDLSGLHAGANAVSGDFSLLCKGYEVKGGRFSRAMEQMTVSGNFYTLLKEITEVASDLRFDPSGIASPSVRVREMTLAGE